jgi:long-chain fatty acid transport protein
MVRYVARAALIAWIVSSGGTVTALAGSGFTLRSQSATTLGSAQAGMTAGDDDISLMIFNPAALGQGSGREITVGSTGLFTSAEFGGAGTTLLGTPITGGNGGNNGTQVLIPNLYGAVDLPANFRLGLAVTSLYGLGAYWDDGWVGRYYALNSQLITQDIVPVLSYRVNPSLLLGVGLDIEYAQVKTTNAIDFGAIGQTLFGGALGGVPAGDDGQVRITAQGWTVGFVAGAQYEPVDGTRFGLSYHSTMHQDLDGSAGFTTGGPIGGTIATLTGAFVPTGVRLGLDLPPTVTFGIQQALGPDWALMADIEWMGWHSLKTLEASFDNPSQPPVTTVLNWDNSWFVDAGAKYRINDAISVRFGVAYDQSPTNDATRTPAIPDANSYWTAVGLEYRVTQNTRIDIAYGHIFVTNGSVAQLASNAGNAVRGSLSGTIKSGSVDYLAAQCNFRF